MQTRPPACSRRELLLGAMAGAIATPAIAGPGGLWRAAPGIDPGLRSRALQALARHERRIWSRDIVAIADFGLPSTAMRFHLIDLQRGRTRSFLVAHGKGSDPAHDGRLHRFSNIVGSEATSEGAYLTGRSYRGEHGAARRLIGLDRTNSNAEDRAIVIHAAGYVGPDVLDRQGKLGRSNGCFVFSMADIAEILGRLGRGRLLYAGR
ncbi:L,D-transpeptidase catalytic domain [Sphingomonas laterariae]|uniref:L,D-transpeptidase catalytic domain n=1 Tax=Edaphosphingomonas laterariae TaxID=861865 RepID=A0A239GA58_9SPHN|nr:murein L,D-transpeptidase catalytic domain family protein [Sphingomonas laterariae]SNS65990.1 L,D-transpeptidase catalytic domain [Sphingomonas laterariae]